jgi:serine protease AprX
MMKHLAWDVALISLLAATTNAAPATARYWVFFGDKALEPSAKAAALARAETQITARSLARRMKSMTIPVDEYDLPLAPAYVQGVTQTGVRIRCGSKWLNAVSVEATPAQVAQLQALPFVKSVESFRLTRANTELRPAHHPQSLDVLHYGESFLQDSLCHVPELHARGLTGRGVLIGFLDTGFNLVHPAFDSLHVLATFDFINGDTIVADEAGQDSAGQWYHGTATLSAMAGYGDSILIGPAYGADVVCAKTEFVPTETQIEEDYYVAGLEWADSLGADITSSSLGYRDWYAFSDLNGHTAVTTIGVNVAVSHGILVVTAAGNDRQTFDWPHILAPADADSILAVGAVASSGIIADFSSPGPTADGRTKPDVCAMGVDVVSANAADSASYYFLSGTSLATPIVAGVAALIMEAHPDWTAQMVRTAILNTASQTSSPDNDYGWGIVNGLAAADYVFPVSDVPAPRASAVPQSAVLLSAYPNPVNGTVTLTLTLPAESEGRLVLYDELGRESHVFNERQWTAGEHRLSFDVSTLATGIYFARFTGNAGVAVQRITVLK